MSTTTVEVEFTLFALNPSVTVQLIPSFVLKVQVAPEHETELLEADSLAIILFENKYANLLVAVYLPVSLVGILLSVNAADAFVIVTLADELPVFPVLAVPTSGNTNPPLLLLPPTLTPVLPPIASLFVLLPPLPVVVVGSVKVKVLGLPVIVKVRSS